MSGHSKWENIKRTKGKNDAIRARITTKISKEITIAARMGGANPTGNMRLKLALLKARQNNVPKDNIKRAIAKGVGASSGAGFDEVTYEGYGPGGAAIIAECNTDNRNRMAADITRSPITAAAWGLPDPWHGCSSAEAPLSSTRISAMKTPL